VFGGISKKIFSHAQLYFPDDMNYWPLRVMYLREFLLYDLYYYDTIHTFFKIYIYIYICLHINYYIFISMMVDAYSFDLLLRTWCCCCFYFIRSNLESFFSLGRRKKLFLCDTTYTRLGHMCTVDRPSSSSSSSDIIIKNIK